MSDSRHKHVQDKERYSRWCEEEEEGEEGVAVRASEPGPSWRAGARNRRSLLRSVLAGVAGPLSSATLH